MAHVQNICEVCGHACRELHTSRDAYILDCPRCGRFEITRTAAINFGRYRDDLKKVALLSGWIREQAVQGTLPQISSEELDRILALPFPPYIQRMEAYLKAAAKRQGSPNAYFDSMDPSFIAVSYSVDANELAAIRLHLVDEDLFAATGGNLCRVTGRGFIETDKLSANIASTFNGFVAMWFAEEMREIYATAFAPAIRAAGYSPIRVDSIEHIGKIDDEIISQIRRAKFLVADFTGHRAGVYFEAGFGLGLGKPVIWTCRKDEIDQLHFDIRQYNCLVWDKAEDLRERLSVRISATIGDGPNPSLS